MTDTPMKTRVKAWLAPPVYPGNEAKTRRASLLNTILIILLLCFFSILPLLFLNRHTPPVVVLIDCLTILPLGLLFLLLRRGWVDLVGSVLLTLIFIWSAGTTALQGTIRSPATAGLLFVVILAGLLFDRVAILIAIIVTSLTVMGLILAENRGRLPEPDYTVSLVQWFTYTALFAVAGGLVYRTAHTALRSLGRAEQEIAERESIELELRRQIFERQQVEAALMESTARQQALFEKAREAIVIADADTGRVLDVNTQAARLFDCPKEHLIGRRQTELHPPEMIAEFSAAFQEHARGEPFLIEAVILSAGGRHIPVEISTSPVQLPNGKLVVQGIFRDISERKQDEALLVLRLELLESAAGCPLEAFLQIALDRIAAFCLSPVGFFHLVEPDQRSLSLQVWSSRTRAEFCTVDEPARHSDIDAAGVWADCLRQGRPVIHNDYPALPGRQSLPPGHVPLARELVVPVFREGKVAALLGLGNRPGDYTEQDVRAAAYLADVVWEIGRRKQSELALTEAESRLSVLGHNLEDAGLYVYAHDLEGRPRFEYVSPGIELLTGVKAEDILRDPANLHSLILPEYLPGLMEKEAQSKVSLTSSEMELRQRHAGSGEARWMLLRSTPRRRPDGSTVWYGVQMDITDRKQNEHLLESANRQLRLHMIEIEQLQEELREQSLRDPLTGLYNRRYLAETLSREIARVAREGANLSLIISDIDHFKAINDNYGHDIGDRFLLQIASLMKSHARGSDIVCRYGGEEFLLALPGSGLADAVRRADELRRLCAAICIQVGGLELSVTMSFGVATFPDHDLDPERIIIKADRALYQSKNLGRNRVTAWGEPGWGTGALFGGHREGGGKPLPEE